MSEDIEQPSDNDLNQNEPAEQPHRGPSVQPVQTQSAKPSFVGVEDVNNIGILRMIAAEFLGTALLVCLGCGACSTTLGSDVVAISLSFGIAVATIAQAIGHVSGAHLNPAVSWGLVVAGECSILKALVYTFTQCFGAIFGAFVLWAAIPEKMRLINFGHTDINKERGMEPLHGLLIEAVITFVLVLTVCGVCDNLRKDIKGSAPLAIGLSLTVCHLWAAPITGSSMNPARTIGPLIISPPEKEPWKNVWVYWLGPLAGGAVAGLVYRFVFHEKPSKD